MPNVSLSGIEFTIKGNADSASDAINKLITNLNKLNSALSNLSGVKDLAKSMNRLKNAMEGLSKIDTKGFAKAMSALTKSMKSMSGITTMAKDMATFARNMNNLAKDPTKLVDVAIWLSRIASIDFMNLQEASQAIKNLADAYKMISGQSDDAAKKVEKGSKALDLLKSAGIGAAKGLGKIVALPFKRAVSNVSAFSKSLSGVLRGFKRIIGYRIIRSIIKEITQGFQEGVKNLYEWSRLTGGAMGSRNKTFAQSLDQIATSLLYFKNSVGAAVAPIINALAPAIDFLVDKIVTLLNVLNQLFAKLTGATSWTRAKKKATEYGDAVSGAGEAAQEALRYLAPFDELNVLPDQKDNGSGGGGGGTDYSDMFEDVTEFNEAIANFADMIREKVNAGDWQGLGELLGNKVNDIVDMIDFAGIGTKVGTGINAWFTTKYWTFETINFTNIAAKISEFFNNAIEQINFNTIGRTITQKFTITGDFILGAIQNINWSQIGQKTSDFFVGAFDQVSEWMASVDWSGVGDSIYSALTNAISGIDFGAVASSMFRFLGSALGGAVSVIASFVRDAINDIWGYFMSYAQDEDGDGKVAGGEILEGILKGIIDAVKNIGSWIKTNVFDPFIEGFKSTFGIHSPATTMEEPGQMIGEGILQGILKPFKDIGAWITNNILNPIKNFLNSDGNNTEVSVEAAVNLVKNGWTSVTSWASEKIGQVAVNSPVDLVKNGWTSVTSWASEKIGGVKVNSPVDLIKNGWSSVTSWAKTKIGGATVNSPVDLAKNGWKSVTSWASEKIGSVKVNNPVDLIKNGWSSVTSWVSDKVGIVKVNSPVGLSKNGWTSVSSWVNDELGDEDVSVDAEANFTSYKDSIVGTPSIDVEANVTDIHVPGGTIKMAQGGVYSGGKWHDIARFAGGGLARGSQLFWARETGSPELVGTLGGHTAVMNNDQIVSSVAFGVQKAVSGIHFKLTGLGSAPSQQDSGIDENTIYRAMLQALNDSDVFPDEIDLDGSVVYRKMVQRNKLERARTGVNPMMAS